MRSAVSHRLSIYTYVFLDDPAHGLGGGDGLSESPINDLILISLGRRRRCRASLWRGSWRRGRRGRRRA